MLLEAPRGYGLVLILIQEMSTFSVILGVERLFLFGLIYDFWSRIYAAALKKS